MQASPQVQEIQQDAPICEVLLFEDRAQLTRKCTLTLPQGLVRVCIPNVTPIAVDRSLQLHQDADASANLTLLEVRLQRKAEKRTQDASAQHERWLQESMQHHQERERLEREEQRLHHQRNALRKLLDEWKLATSRSAGRNEDNTEQWAQQLETIRAALQSVATRLPNLAHEQKQCDDKLEAIAQRAMLTEQPEPQLTAQLEALFSLDAPCEATLRWEYLVPCALWRPAHQAHLQEETQTLTFSSAAMVWQHTGEDWKEVTLRCSTARPSQVTSAPLLQDEYLSSRLKSHEERKTIIASLRDEDISETGFADEHNQMPGIDDGGEVRQFTAMHPVTVPSDGRPVRVPLTEWNANTQSSWLCIPTLAPHLLLQTRQTNNSHMPLLAGPVRLIQKSGYVGSSTISYVSPQENFALGWGSEDLFRVHRTQDVHHHTRALSGQQQVTFVVKLYLSNLAATPLTFELHERIPTSELEQIQISLVDKPGLLKEHYQTPHDPYTQPKPDHGPDENGLLRWHIKLAPHDHQTLTLTYTIQAPSQVTLPF